MGSSLKIKNRVSSKERFEAFVSVSVLFSVRNLNAAVRFDAFVSVSVLFSVRNLNVVVRFEVFVSVSVLFSVRNLKAAVSLVTESVRKVVLAAINFLSCKSY